jgi:hypothetical protein
VFVLDDDIDPANETELVWAIATRLHPVQRQEVWTGPILRIFGGYLDIEKAAGIGPVVVHDGLQPAPGDGRLPQSSFAQAYPDHIRLLVLDHWDED